MGMPRGLLKATNYYNRIEAVREWDRMEKAAIEDGVNLGFIEKCRPGPKSTIGGIYKAAERLRAVLNEHGEGGEQ